MQHVMHCKNQSSPHTANIVMLSHVMFRFQCRWLNLQISPSFMTEEDKRQCDILRICRASLLPPCGAQLKCNLF